MAATEGKLKAAVDDYFAELRRIRATGGGTGELSYYPPLNNLLNAVGGSLRPRVHCVSQLTQQGAGHPDFGLYGARQVSKGQPKQGQLPDGGVVEVKAASDDAWLTADSAQVSGYWDRYRLVLVTNTRDFVLLGEDRQGDPVRLETFRLADSAAYTGRVVTYEHLLQRVWGDKSNSDVRAMRTIVSSLRRKLGDDADNPTYIFTEPRVGYRMPKGEMQEREGGPGSGY